MSDTTSQEPTMEEILASIRRIISEDDAPAAVEAAPEEEPAAAAPEEPLPVVEEEDEDDGVLELTERVETMGDLDVYTPPGPSDDPAEEFLGEAPFEADSEPAADLPPVSPGGRLVGDPAAAAAAAAFGALSSTLLMGNADRTLEDVVRELLRPLLKQWLDDNLPRIVEATVSEEVERIARNRVR